MKSFFSDKHTISKTITLIEGENIISGDVEVAEIMNNLFANGVDTLNIQGYFGKINVNDNLDPVSNAINICRDHPSIIKIKEIVHIAKHFSFSFTEEVGVAEIISQLNTKKHTTFNNIPAKVLVENSDTCAPFISEILNDSISQEIFPNSLKVADITPGHKKFDKSNKANYRPVSILPTISKVFDRNMFEQINTYMSDYLSQ